MPMDGTEHHFATKVSSMQAGESQTITKASKVALCAMELGHIRRVSRRKNIRKELGMDLLGNTTSAVADLDDKFSILHEQIHYDRGIFELVFSVELDHCSHAVL